MQIIEPNTVAGVLIWAVVMYVVFKVWLGMPGWLFPGHQQPDKDDDQK